MFGRELAVSAVEIPMSDPWVLLVFRNGSRSSHTCWQIFACEEEQLDDIKERLSCGVCGSGLWS